MSLKKRERRILSVGSATVSLNKKPLVTIFLDNGDSIDFLIDTGSDVCLISDQVQKHFIHNIHFSELSTISGSPLSIKGRCDLTFSIQSKKYTWPVLVCELPSTLPFCGVLGWDFLQNYLQDFHIFSTKNNQSTPNSNCSTQLVEDETYMPTTSVLVPPPMQIHVLPKKINPQFADLVEKFSDLFSVRIQRSDLDIHSIVLKSEEPVRCGPRRVPLFYVNKIYEMLRQYENMGVIRRSNSAFCAPVVIVPKKSGDLRFCCDYRALNAATIRDSYPIPTFEEVRDSLQGSTVFSKFDLRSGYWQLGLSPESQHKTAFSPGPQFGLWEWTVLPFGLTNAVGTFQRAMMRAFSDMPFVTIYLDDVFVHSKNMEWHTLHLKQFFQRAQSIKLTLAGDKCDIGNSQIEVLGHTIGYNKVKMSDSKLNSIVHWPVPSTKKQLVSFLGLCNYDSRFIEKYADISAPLYTAIRPNVKFQWSDELSAAFEILKDAFATEVCLELPDPKLQFDLHTDASGVAVSGVLSQQGRPVEFASRLLSSSERNYTIVYHSTGVSGYLIFCEKVQALSTRAKV